MITKQPLIPVFQPNYDKKEIEAVSQVLKSGWIGLGPKTEEFEKRFAEYVGAPYAIALNSATAALHLSLLAAGIGKGDEVIIPSLTFVSTAHAVLYVGAKPIFADIERDTLCIDPADVIKKITKRTRAIIPVHYGGHPCDMDTLKKIADEHHLTMIEDASHACGSSYHNEKIGSISPFTCFSFHAVKNLATGDGGMITVKDKTVADHLRRLRWVGINKDTWDRLEEVSEEGEKSYRAYGWYYEVEELGYKCHMNDITAAIGLVQLQKLETANTLRRSLAERYTRELEKLPEIICPTVRSGMITAQHNYVIRCKDRDKLHLYLRDHGISSGVHYMPAHLHPYYKRLYPAVRLPITDIEWKNLLTLPLYPDLNQKKQDYIVKNIKEFYS
ncbi:MAG: DegT/DnrJ/EryC1/StrS aminotransferase family protein [Candidatus Gottesmanbacteria bacterium]|nr:DegT/DnrJ/EryC1/StrS aminotransferase family protein [Candidatus Gottesmanbacteria bacterium]